MTVIISTLVQKSFSQQTVRYDLYVTDTTLRYAGKISKGIAINGQTPAPTLTFTEGDTAVIFVHNQLNTETSIHWHGIILPNNQDGVPFLTMKPIRAHTTFVYKFPIVQNGTYWYHSHTELQEQMGLFGALILNKRTKDTLPEYTVLLSDYTHERPMEVMRSLKNASDWYAIKKHSVQSWGEAIMKGYFSDKVKQEWKRMYPMDVSDVYYDAFLTNGNLQQHLPELKAGSRIKLRIINGSASTYFWLQYAGSKLKVIASDGEDVVPVEADRMLIAVAETYDIIVTVPENMSYEFRATAEDRSKSTSLWLGDGMKMPAPVLSPLKYFEGMKMMNSMMKFNGQMDNMGMQMSNQQMDMNSVMYPEATGEEKKKKKHTSSKKEKTQPADNMQMDMGDNSNVDIVTLNYGMLKAVKKTSLPAGPTKILNFNLTGNMNRYQWSINNNTLGDTDKILIHKGENVRIILSNQTMMRHPMHLHGHYFRVINGQEDYAPLKNVLDIMPMETDTIEFAAQYDGDWFFHCHILYHMMSGMGRIFSYANSPPNPSVDSIKHSWRKFTADERMWHLSTSISAQSQGIFLKAMVMNRRYVFDAMAKVNYAGGFETETHLAIIPDRQQYFRIYIGSDIRMLHGRDGYIPMAHHEDSKLENRIVGTLGIQYLLPFFIQTDLRMDNTGRVRFQISRSDLPITSRLRLDAMWNTDMEYEVGLRYIILKRLSVAANYDSHFGPGAGVMFTY